MTMRKDIQAKHIQDMTLLEVVSDLMRASAASKFRPCDDEFLWTHTWDIQKRFPDVPRKVIAAKLAALVKRKLLDGCTCGCRGDFVVTSHGRAFMAGTRASEQLAANS